MHFYLDREDDFPKTLHQSTKSPRNKFTIFKSIHIPFWKSKNHHKNFLHIYTHTFSNHHKNFKRRGWKPNQNPSLQKRRGPEMEALKTLVLDEYRSCHYRMPIVIVIPLLLEEEKRVSIFLDCATLLTFILRWICDFTSTRRRRVFSWLCYSFCIHLKDGFIKLEVKSENMQRWEETNKRRAMVDFRVNVKKKKKTIYNRELFDIL